LSRGPGLCSSCLVAFSSLPPTKATFCGSVTSITCEDVKDFWLFRRFADQARSNLQRLPNTCQCKPSTKEMNVKAATCILSLLPMPQGNAVSYRWRHRAERSNQRQRLHASVKAMTCPSSVRLRLYVIFSAFNRLLLGSQHLVGPGNCPSIRTRGSP